MTGGHIMGYYLQLAWRSVRRTPVMSGLMVLAIGLGIGASITMLTVLHNLSGNPLPGRSDGLFHPQIDPRPLKVADGSDEPPADLTYQDAEALYRLGGASAQVITSSNWLPTRRDRADSTLAMFTTRATTHAFFAMFGVPMRYGAPWSAQDDQRHAQVVVLSSEMNQQLFGGADSVGQALVIATKLFRVVGVTEAWNPQPRFFDLNSGAFGKPEQMYLPFDTWLDLPQDYGYGPMRCWGHDAGAGLHDPKAAQCTWVQYWVQLDSPAQREAYRRQLVGYSQQQHATGRFERAPNVRLRGLLEWLDANKVIPVTVRMQTWIAFGVFLICMVNVVGLMVAKFLRKSVEIGVRRALGASRRDVFVQCLVEAAVIGISGGLLGLPLAWLGVWMVRQQPVAFAAQAQLNLSMLLAALLLALLASLLAGIWPSWRAARVAPALQVKSL